jgi:hypothetical protein
VLKFIIFRFHLSTPSMRLSWTLLRKRVGRVGYNSADCPVSQAANGSCQRQWSARNQLLPHVLGQRSLGRTGLSGVAWGQRLAMVDYVKKGRESCTVRCPMHPQIEGNQGLPNEDQTAPWSPWDYKRTP